MKNLIVLLSIALLSSCTSSEPKKEIKSDAGLINETVVKNTIDTVKTAKPAADLILLSKGVKHAASLWRKEDGSEADFTKFV
ncbi:MAG TPA: hypothetical protein VIK07_04115, partial [Bacteroidales bacterium]